MGLSDVIMDGVMLHAENISTTDITLPHVVFLDGCTDIYDEVRPIFAKHFRLSHVILANVDDILKSSPPDAVIIIVGKAQYEQAFTWLRQARQQSNWETIPLIPYINSVDDAIVLSFLDAGATECFVYPIASDVMVARLNAQIKTKRQFDIQKAQLETFQKNYLSQAHLIEIGAHDLQHPLTDLLMIQEVMRQYELSGSQIPELLDDMSNALNNMREILDDFLTALNLRSGIQIKPELMPVADVIYDIGLKYAVRGITKKINVLIGQTPGMVYADPKRLGQIVENLVSNAVKYSPPDKEVHIWSEISPEGTYIRVRDWGAGIPEDERVRLFSEFGKLSTRPTGNEGSVGLGLWVVKTLAEAMNGEVGARFPEEGGSIFWVRLPTHPPA